MCTYALRISVKLSKIIENSEVEKSNFFSSCLIV